MEVVAMASLLFSSLFFVVVLTFIHFVHFASYGTEFMMMDTGMRRNAHQVLGMS
jgi:hypothetical protein